MNENARFFRHLALLMSVAMLFSALGALFLNDFGPLPEVSTSDEEFEEAYLVEQSKSPENRGTRSPATTTRSVLVELFTGTWCPPCQGAEGALDRLANEYPNTDLSILEWHLSDAYSPSDGSEAVRRDYYKAGPNFYVPSAFFDGEDMRIGGSSNPDDPVMYNDYKTRIDNALTDPAQLTITVTGNLDDPAPNQATIVANITAIDDITTGNLHARFVVYEDHNYTVWVSGREYRLRYTVVKTLPEEAITISKEQSLEFTRTFNIDPAWNRDQLGVVVFVQTDDKTYHPYSDTAYWWAEILQATTFNFTLSTPDLAVTPSDISFSDPNPNDGDTVTIYATVHNIGKMTPSGLVYIRFYDGDPDFGGTQIGFDQVVAPIASGGTADVQVDWDTTGLEGDHEIVVIVDPDDIIFEPENENNNKAPRNITVEGVLWTANYVQIRTASGGGGTNLCDPANYPSYPVGHTTTFYGASYNFTKGYIGGVSATSFWNSGDPSIVTVTTPGSSSTVTCSNTNSGTVWIFLVDDSGNFNNTQVTVLDPTIDYILIRDASNGGGVNLCDPANYPCYPVGYITTLYGAAYNFTAGYIGDIPATSTWDSNNTGIVTVSSPGIFSTVTCSNTNNGTVTITLDDGNSHINTTQITVLEPTIDYIQIRDAPNGGGKNLCDPANYPGYPVGYITTLYGAAYNLTAGYIGDVPLTSTWDSDNSSVVDVSLPGSSSTVTCSNTNSGTVTITLDDGNSHINTTQITVLEPTVDYIRIRDGLSGGGTNLCDPANYPSYPVGYITAIYGAVYNYTAGYIGDVPATSTWDSDNTSVADVSSPGNSSTITCSNTNSGTVTITLDDGNSHINTTQIIVLEPTVDYIQIRDAPGGGGINLCDPANYPSYPVGYITTLYSAAYNFTADYIGDVPLTSTWDSDNTSVADVSSPGNSSTITCSNTNSGTVTITLDDGNSHINTTQIIVLEPTVDYIQIRNGPGGGGTNLCDPANYPSYPAGYITTLYGVAYNYTAGYIGDVPTTSTWDSDNTSVVTVSSPWSSSTITCNNTNSGTVTIILDDGNSHINTTQVTVLVSSVDYILIRDASNGGGANLCDPANYPCYPVGYITTLYGAAYNYTAGYIGDVPAMSTWDSDNLGIVTVSSPGVFSTITCSNTNSGTVTITLDDGNSHINTTQITVLDPTADYILIRDAPNGGGKNLCDPANYPCYPVGYITTLYGAAYNYTAGYIGDVPATSIWDSDNTSVVGVSSPGIFSTITCSNTNNGTVTVTLDDGNSHINTTQITVLEPTVDYIQIRDAPNGGGKNLCDPANYPSYHVGYITPIYGAAYNYTAGYIGDVPAISTWDSDNTSVVGVSSPGIFSTVTCSNTNNGTVTITLDDGNSHINTTQITVLEPTIDYIQIRDAPGGGGKNLCDPANYPGYPVGYITTLYGAAYNLTAGYIGDVPLTSTWDSDNSSVVDVSLPGSSSTVTCSNTNSGTVTITLDDGNSHINTTQITVLEPTVDYIRIRDGLSGGGTNLCDPANYPSYPVGYITAIYGAAYNYTAGYIGDVPATSTWDSDNTSIVDVSSPGVFSTVTCNDTNSGTTTITLDDGNSHVNGTQVTILEPTVDNIQIRNQPGDGGLVVTDPTLNVGETIELWAAAYNYTSGYLEDATALWDCTDDSVGNITGSVESGLFKAIDIGTCIVTAEYGGKVGSTGTITVIDITPPTADASEDTLTVNEDTSIEFNGSASHDNGRIVYYNWSFGDGSYANGTEQITTHNYTEPGIYTITLTVTDLGGNTDIDEITLIVLDVTPPTAIINLPDSVEEKAPCSFDGNDSFDNVGIVVYIWEFGDGSYNYSIYPNVTHIYEKARNYTVNLTVEDAAGNFDTDSAFIIVEDLTPPSTPEGLVVERMVSGEALEIRWNAVPDLDLDHYELYCSEVNGTYTKIADIDAGETTYTHDGLERGNSYRYYLIAVDTSGNPSLSSLVVEGIPDIDSDSDSIFDLEDYDDDNDGLLDANELTMGTDPLNPDSDGDTYIDGMDEFPTDTKEWIDGDGDGYGDAYADAFPNDPKEWKDSDDDGIGDNSDFLPTVHNLWFLIITAFIIILIIIGVLLMRHRRGDVAEPPHLQPELGGATIMHPPPSIIQQQRSEAMPKPSSRPLPPPPPSKLKQKRALIMPAPLPILPEQKIEVKPSQPSSRPLPPPPPPKLKQGRAPIMPAPLPIAPQQEIEDVPPPSSSVISKQKIEVPPPRSPSKSLPPP